jgi:sarcosine oxidase
MSNNFSTIVIGLGAVGSSTLYQLSKIGNTKVLGIEQFTSPHSLGSSHGETRITRLAIGEGEVYSPLAIRSHQIWREIEHKAQLNLFNQIGGLFISSKEGSTIHVENFFATTLDAAKKFNISHEILEQAEIQKRYPIFNLDVDEYAYFEPDAGYLNPELCIKAQLDLAHANGAKIHMNEKLLSYEQFGNQIKVVTTKNEYFTETSNAIAQI